MYMFLENDTGPVMYMFLELQAGTAAENIHLICSGVVLRIPELPLIMQSCMQKVTQNLRGIVLPAHGTVPANSRGLHHTWLSTLWCHRYQAIESSFA